MRRFKVLLFTLLASLALPTLAAGTPAQLYKNPNCGCCDEYAKYLQANGFEIDVVPTHDMAQMQNKNGVPERLSGCHVTKIGAYLFVGHIPVQSIKRVLDERPLIKGLAVPGMPAGTPGMPGPKQGPLHVYYLSNDTPPKIYATY